LPEIAYIIIVILYLNKFNCILSSFPPLNPAGGKEEQGKERPLDILCGKSKKFVKNSINIFGGGTGFSPHICYNEGVCNVDFGKRRSAA
jgi:hypothetical protein